MTITLTSSDPTKVSVPATVTIGINQTVFVPVTGLELTGGTPVTISATATGYNSPATNLSVSVLPPNYSYCQIDTARSVISARDSVQLCNPLQPGTTEQRNSCQQSVS